ncbi:hypothetical protein BH23GEM9_BH23GEM9_23820 [soil metagenome]
MHTHMGGRRAIERAAARISALAALALITLVTAACAGSTYRSGVGDAFFEHPPFYAGRAVVAGGTIARLPVSYQRGASQSPIFDPSDAGDRPAAALLTEMNAWLDSLGVTVRIDARPSGTAPDVLFGCERAPGDECDNVDSRLSYRLAVTRPSRTWVDWAAGQAANVGADRVLVVTLEVGNYLPRQRNWRGSKEILLGTGHSMDLPWLTGVDQPTSVLQITGVLLDAQGRAIRIGAEGLLARRTNLLIGAINGQVLITDDDVEAVRTARRDDLPGQPLVWQVALSNLVAQLTGTPGLAVR